MIWLAVSSRSVVGISSPSTKMWIGGLWSSAVPCVDPLVSIVFDSPCCVVMIYLVLVGPGRDLQSAERSAIFAVWRDNGLCSCRHLLTRGLPPVPWKCCPLRQQSITSLKVCQGG